MVTAGNKVKFDYKLSVENEVIESTEGKSPLEYTHGENTIIPGLERHIEGMKVGDEKTIVVDPNDAYGQFYPHAVHEVERNMFPANLELKAGLLLRLQDNDGNPMPALIKEIKEATVVIDFNHPLAGKVLTFDVKVVDIQ